MLDHCVEVRVHELKHKIEVDVVGCLDNIQELNDVLMRRKSLHNMTSHDIT